MKITTTASCSRPREAVLSVTFDELEPRLLGTLQNRAEGTANVLGPMVAERIDCGLRLSLEAENENCAALAECMMRRIVDLWHRDVCPGAELQHGPRVCRP